MLQVLVSLLRSIGGHDVALCEAASSQFTFLSWSSTTGRATDGKYLFWAEFFLHGRKIMPQSDALGWSILTNSR